MSAALAFALLAPPLPVGPAFEEVATFQAPEAHQAVAVDATHFYAIGNRVIGKYDKRTGERVARFEASEEVPLIHMNGGVTIDGWLVVSHSNFPLRPMTSSVELFETDRMIHAGSSSLGPADGSLTAVLPTTWAGSKEFDTVGLFAGNAVQVFAHYELPRIPGYDTGTERTRVTTQFAGLREEYVLPDALVRRLRPHSVSGASYGPEGKLWLSGHDLEELYRMSVPRAGSEMILEAVHPAPIAGQGIAWDPSEPGVLWGTRRGEGLVVKMRLTGRQ